MLHLELVQARERFVSDLIASGISYTIIRPTGFYSDLTALLQMANRGTIFLIGNGRCRLNPIHGADLAAFCVRMAGSRHQVTVAEAGGPEIFSQRELAELAFESAGRSVRIVSLPPWLCGIAIGLIKPFNKKLYGTLAFFVKAMQLDMVVPGTGERRLKDYFEAYKLPR